MSVGGDRPAGPAQQPLSNWGSRLRRGGARPPRRFVWASLGLHFGVVALLVIAGFGLTGPPQFEQFRVTLISPPPQVQGEPEPVVTSTPVVVQPEAPKPEPEKPKPQEPVRTQAPQQKPVEKKPDPAPAKGPDPKPSSVGGENIQVEQDGREFQYPEYLENIALQINRYFRWSGPADLEAEVMFFIMTDGSVGGIRVVRKSGNFRFDMQTAAALDEIGKVRAFGPLPEGWQRDRLYIQYTFQKPKS